MLSLSSTIPLRRGARLPLYGLGTWLSDSNAARDAVAAALQTGYRLIDTAAYYNNEGECGEGLRLSSIPRSDVFIVSKLKPDDHGREATLAAAARSRDLLGVDAIDLFLIHNPSGGRVVETWRAMLEARDAGLVRAVGVSNFGIEQLRGLAAAGLEAPEVLQVELHCWYRQRELVEYCCAEKIAIMAFCPLARAKHFAKTPLAALAVELGRSEADVCLRWCVQQGFCTIPKSVSAERIRANAAIFDFSLDDAALARIGALDSGLNVSMATLAQDKPWAEVA